MVVTIFNNSVLLTSSLKGEGLGLLKNLKLDFEKIPDPRKGKVKIAYSDAIMSAFAMFSLKDPSLLVFDQRKNDKIEISNLKNIYALKMLLVIPRCEPF